MSGSLGAGGAWEVGAETQPAAEKEAHTLIPGHHSQARPSCGPWVSRMGRTFRFALTLDHCRGSHVLARAG